jgi:hypothetical protein
MQAPLAEDGTALQRGNGLTSFWTRQVTGDCDEGGEFHVSECGKFREMGVVFEAFATPMERWEVFCDWESVRTGCEISHADTIGNEALMGCNAGVEFSEGLLKMDLKIGVEDVVILTEDFVPK